MTGKDLLNYENRFPEVQKTADRCDGVGSDGLCGIRLVYDVHWRRYGGRIRDSVNGCSRLLRCVV